MIDAITDHLKAMEEIGGNSLIETFAAERKRARARCKICLWRIAGKNLCGEREMDCKRFQIRPLEMQDYD
jgi:hypothetical protein